MQAPIYNDRGQFRYSDFVAYMPEFLKTEPDVVTLLQVFSDYINNAYRNIETVEKFEFAIVSRSGELTRAVERMEYLRSMLDLAGARNDYVNLLSVPRANVKSNAVFGSGSGYSAYTVNYHGNEIADRIEKATSVDPGLAGFNDGDVVFVSYDGLQGETDHEVAYYYDASANCLVRDSEGTSQDPFTGTDNSSGRVLTFKVSDVSSVKTRYGYTTENGTQYKEVFFTARIYDVGSAPSVKEITLPGGQKAVIDYYDTDRTRPGTMRTAIRFDNERGWGWLSGYPTAIIYLSETSGGNLSSVKGLDGSRLPVNCCIDPEYMETVNRYAVVGKPSVADSIVTVQLGSCYPAYSSGTVYLVTKGTKEVVGEFTVLKDDRESGRLDVRMAPVGAMPDLSTYEAGDLVLVDIPLFYGRGTLDYTQSSPLIKFDSLIELVRKDEDGLNLVPDNDMMSFACDTVGNREIGTLNIVKKDDPDRTHSESYLDGGYGIVIPADSELAAGFGTEYDLGDRIYIGDGRKYWSGLAIVKEFTRVPDGYLIRLEGIDSPIRPFRLDEPATVMVASAGYINVSDGSVGYGYYRESLLSDKGSIVVLSGDTGEFAVHMYPDGTMDKDVPDGTYTMEVLNETGDRARILLRVDNSDGMATTVWSRSRGDLFTRAYMLLTDKFGNGMVGRVAFAPGEEVTMLVPGDYAEGQYVYDPVSKKVYRCIEDCTVRDTSSVPSSNMFTEDRIVHYSVPYAEKFNSFMPYYGPIAALEYDARIEYSSDPEVFTAPLYIHKVEEKSLKYGWEHREFLNYGDTLNLSGRPRNGMVEIHTSERTNADTAGLTADNGMDIVNSDLFERCTWSYPHGVVTRGCSHYVSVDIDDPVAIGAERVEETGDWRVTIHSAAHGLVDGSIVSVSGLSPAELKGTEIDLNAGFTRVDVVDGDTFTYDVPSDQRLIGRACWASRNGNERIVYIQDHHVEIASMSVGRDGLTVAFADKVHGLVPGDLVYIEGCTLNGHDFPTGPYKVIDVMEEHGGITVEGTFGNPPVPGNCAIVRKPIGEGDVVVITDADDNPLKFYEVGGETWEQVSRDTLVTPFTLFSQMNLFDRSATNPSLAMGDEIVVRDIVYAGNGIATVHLAAPLVHFTEANRGYIEGKTVVFIENVNPSDFNGYHVVKTVHGPTSFDVTMRLYNDYTNTGIPVGDLDMKLRECRWYKYTVNSIEWDKPSAQATFTGKNRTTEIGSDGSGNLELMCELEHGLTAGDYVVFGYAFDRFDETTGLSEYAMGRVSEAVDERNVKVKVIYGEYASGMSINRGVITLPGSDNIPNRYGEYSVRLASVGNEMCHFRDGDIVIAAGQLVPGERLSYLVRANAGWSVLKRKRIIKIRDITVDEYLNSEYMDGAVEDNLDEYRYATYSDVDVAKESYWAYATRRYMTRNPVFNKPAISGIDTTREVNAEYSSGEDYANVAPRDDMKSTFKGVPDLKYPLIEKIERLAYLRDANVIDYDLIGYLARFMGYDLTPMADDVQTSNLYRTIKQQEAAIRSAVLNLPQYYALGGTNPGLKMLMGAFGVIGDILTLYTNTMHPYEELLNKEEVDGRLEDDTANGKIEGTWVSTPYIDIALTDDSRFPQFAIQSDDIQRIREQIRVWKPIQVVFRDVVLKYVGEIGMKVAIGSMSVGVSEFGTAIGLSGGEDEEVNPEYIDPALTNCAF